MSTTSTRRARRARRRSAGTSRAEARHRRAAVRRYAVPYDLEGPKVTLGIAWLVAAVLAAVVHPFALAALVAVVAGLAGAQVADAWRSTPAAVPPPCRPLVEPRVVGLVAAALPVAALAGTTALGAAVVVAALLAATAAPVLAGGLDAGALTGAQVAVRSAVPAGVAAGSLVALLDGGQGAVISLLLVVGAYEMADFLIGSGSSNAIEGPLAGIVSAAVVAAVVAVIGPAELADRSLLLVALAVVLAPLGQLAASAVLPRGVAWAPALRRLDSYLLSAPLWLVLV